MLGTDQTLILDIMGATPDGCWHAEMPIPAGRPFVRVVASARSLIPRGYVEEIAPLHFRLTDAGWAKTRPLKLDDLNE